MNIHYFTPFSITKDIGGAINKHCDLVKNPDDWIVILDGDMMFLQPDWGVVIHNALEKDGDKFGLIGCYTNRLRGLHQLHNNAISHDHDILNHYKIAEEYQGKEGISDLNLFGVAGIFMAFKKSTYDKVGGFNQNNITADTYFNLKVRKLGMKIGIINGLYVYHAYRPWNNINPADDWTHLK